MVPKTAAKVNTDMGTLRSEVIHISASPPPTIVVPAAPKTPEKNRAMMLVWMLVARARGRKKSWRNEVVSFAFLRLGKESSTHDESDVVDQVDGVSTYRLRERSHEQRNERESGVENEHLKAKVEVSLSFRLGS